MLEFRILGPLEVAGDAGPVPVRAPKQRATLAILLLDANRVVSVDRLADGLYAGAAPVTAVTQVQRQVSELRKALGAASGIETRAPGYVLHITSGQLDLARFQQGAEEGGLALARGEYERADDLLRDALALWRGPPLADLAYELFAQTAIDRLEEIRLTALEQRIEAQLALGRDAELVGELEELVAVHPLRERIRGQLMLALYRSGRQAEALEVYRRTRDALVGEFGIDPSPALRELERAILAQDRALVLTAPARQARAAMETPGSVLVVTSTDERLAPLLSIAQRLAQPRRELIIARLLADDAELEHAAAHLNERRASSRVVTRTAVFTTRNSSEDVVRLASVNDVALVLMDAPPGIDADALPDAVASVLERSPADVALFAGSAAEPSWSAGVFVPFGGGDHDWTALEIGAWLARSGDAALTLVGTRADPRRGERDASRMLADAGLAVQRLSGVETRPLLAYLADEALTAAVDPASIVVAGISPRWRREGIGAARRALVRHARPPILLVHQGRRPGALAPPGSGTRFSWSIEARAG